MTGLSVCILLLTWFAVCIWELKVEEEEDTSDLETEGVLFDFLGQERYVIRYLYPAL